MVKRKYDPLKIFLIDISSEKEQTALTFQAIEKILGFGLVSSAYNRSLSWWGNDRSHSQARAWLDAGWNVSRVDFRTKSVVFRRARDTSTQSEKKGQLHCTPQDTLIVVSCTAQKIWRTALLRPSYVPAACAYTGSTMKKWQDERRRCTKLNRFPWVILSAKSGFIEPEHPIGDYDVTFSKPKTGPISFDSLKSQVQYQKRDIGGKKTLAEFDCIVVLGGEQYREAVANAFGRAKKVVDFVDFCRHVCP